MLGYPNAKRSVTRLLLASMLIAVLIIMAIPMASNAVGESSDFYGFAVKYQDGPRKIELMWDKGNLQNGWAEGEWVPYQLLITDVDMDDLSGYVVEYDVYNPQKNAQFVDLVRGFQIKFTSEDLDPTEANLFRLQNTNQGWPNYTLPTGTFPTIEAYNTGIDAVEVAQNAEMDIPEALGEGTLNNAQIVALDTVGDIWPGFRWLDISYDQINLGAPLSDTPDSETEFNALQPSDSFGYFIITKDDLRRAGVPENTTTLVLYFQFHLSRTSLWSSGLYHGYSSPSVPAHEWGGYVYGSDPADPFYEVTRMGSKYYSEGSAGHAMLLGAAKTVPIPVPGQNLGSVEGFKRDATTGLGLEGWPVYVSAEIDSMNFILGTITDETGHYSFPSLTYGMRYITEGQTRINPDTLLPETWMQTSPVSGDGVFDIDLLMMTSKTYREYFRDIVESGNLMYIPPGTEDFVPVFNPPTDLADDLGDFGYVVEIKSRSYAFTEKNFENEFVGCMKIVKLFDGYSNVLGFNTSTMLPTSIEVTIKGNTAGLSYPEAGTDVTITGVEGVYEWQRCDLIPGSYTVTENTLDGWSVDIEPEGGVLTVVAGEAPAESAVATITNTYLPGCMKIVKLFDGYSNVLGFNTSTMLPASIEVTIKGNSAGLSYPEAGTDVTITGVEGVYEWQRCDLIPGSYTVTEKTLDGWSVDIEPEGGVLTVVAGEAPAESAVATITNTYLPGCMKIVKLFNGYPDTMILPASIDVTISGNTDGLSYPTTGTTVTITGVEGVYEWQRCDLIPGSYTVAENTLDGWSVAIDPEDGILTVVAGVAPAESAIATITNTLDLCEDTIWAYNEDSYCFPGTGNWGFYSGPLSEGNYEFDLWAGAANCDLSKGTHVGTLYVTYESGTVSFYTVMLPGYTQVEFSHVYTSDTAGAPSFPDDFTKDTLANDSIDIDFTGEIYFAYHSVVMMPCGD